MERIRLSPQILAFLPLLLLFRGNSVSAQIPANKFLFSVSEYYSHVTDGCTMEMGVGYLFPKVGVRVNYENVGWYDNRICHGGTVSVFVPIYKIGSFSMIPEVAAGILYGNIVQRNEMSIKTQIQANVKLNYTISRYMSVRKSRRMLLSTFLAVLTQKVAVKIIIWILTAQVLL